MLKFISVWSRLQAFLIAPWRKLVKRMLKSPSCGGVDGEDVYEYGYDDEQIAVLFQLGDFDDDGGYSGGAALAFDPQEEAYRRELLRLEAVSRDDDVALLKSSNY